MPIVATRTGQRHVQLRVPFGIYSAVEWQRAVTFLSISVDTHSRHPDHIKSASSITKHELRQFQRDSSHHSRIRNCGLRWKCTNGFLCGYCAEKRRRSDELAIADALRGAPQSEFVTLTMRHGLLDSLSEQWRTLDRAWSKMTSGKAWMSFRTRFSIAGSSRSFDITWSRDEGWHPHFHAAFIFMKILSPSMVAAFRAELAGRWVRCLEGVGASGERYSQTSEAVANPGAVAHYLTDGGPLKRARADPDAWTLGDLLASAIDGSLTALDLVREFERASTGQHAISMHGAFRRSESPNRKPVHFL